MLGIHDLALFVVSGLLLNITPGPDLIYITGRSASQGFRAGAAAALGVGAGCCAHILAAACGLSALLAASATAFALVKLAGAAYLVWVGLSMILSAGRAEAGQGVAKAAAPPASGKTIFVQGFLTNALNPKVALFFLAFLPQFIDPAAPGKTLAFLTLGLIFNVNGMAVCLSVAWAAARLAARLGSRRSDPAAGVLSGRRLGAWINRGLGALFVSFGLKLGLSE